MRIGVKPTAVALQENLSMQLAESIVAIVQAGLLMLQRQARKMLHLWLDFADKSGR